MQKSNQVEHPILDLIKNRRSARAFSNQPIEPERIYSLFEATRWAPSSTNEQPWLYIYATRDQTELWTTLFECLNEGNKVWAKDAPLLILSLARKNFSQIPRCKCACDVRFGRRQFISFLASGGNGITGPSDGRI